MAYTHDGLLFNYIKRDEFFPLATWMQFEGVSDEKEKGNKGTK